MRKNDFQRNYIAGMLLISIISFSMFKYKIRQFPSKKEVEVVDFNPTYKIDTLLNYVVVEAINNYTNEKEYFIASKVYSKYSYGKKYNYLEVLSDTILDSNEFTFIKEEPLNNYLSDFKNEYYYEDIYNNYYDISYLNYLRKYLYIKKKCII